MTTFPRRLAVLLLVLAATGCFDFRKDLLNCVRSGDCAAPVLDGGATEDGGTGQGGDGGAAPAGPFCSGAGWCFETPLPHVTLLQVAAFAPDDVWVFGDRGTTLHSDGARWSPVSVSTQSFYSLVAFGPKNMLLGGFDGVVRFDGTSAVAIGAAGPVRSLSGVSADDFWLVTANRDGLKHVVSGSATSESPPCGTPSAISASAPSALYLGCAGGALYRRTGSAWTPETSPTTQDITRILALDDQNAWAAAGNALLHRVDGGWIDVGAGLGSTIGDLAGSAPDDVWAVAYVGVAVHWNGTSLDKSSFEAGYSVDGVSASRDGGVWAVGQAGRIVQRVGLGWRALPNGSYQNLSDVHGSSLSDVWAVGANGTTLHFDGRRWEQGTAGAADLNGVFVLSPNEAWTVGQGGTLKVRKGGAWKSVGSPSADLYGVWAASSSKVFAVGSGGTMLLSDGAAVTPVQTQTTVKLSDVSGVDATDVWAVGEADTVVRCTGAGPTCTKSSTGTGKDLLSVYARKANDVFVGATGGLVVHFDGQSWATLNGLTNNYNRVHRVRGDPTTGGIITAQDNGSISRGDETGLNAEESGAGEHLLGAYVAPGGGMVVVGGQGVLLRKAR